MSKTVPWDYDRFKALAESAGFAVTMEWDPLGIWWRVLSGGTEVAHALVNQEHCNFQCNHKWPADSARLPHTPFNQDQFDEMFHREFAPQIAEHAAKQRPDPVKSHPLTIDKAVRLSELLQRYANELSAVYKTLDEINATSTRD